MTAQAPLAVYRSGGLWLIPAALCLSFMLAAQSLEAATHHHDDCSEHNCAVCLQPGSDDAISLRLGPHSNILSAQTSTVHAAQTGYENRLDAQRPRGPPRQ